MFHLNHLRDFGKSLVLKYFDQDSVIEHFSYENLCIDSSQLCQYLNHILNGSLITKIENKNCVHYNVAVILQTHSPALLPAFIGITNAHGSSCFISASNSIDTIFEYMAKLESNLILCELQNIDSYKNEQITLRHDLKLFGRECVLIQIQRLKFHTKLIPTEADITLHESPNILFFALTSGTCGESKLIGVTQKCFIPNILSLGELYGLSNDDVIFVSSPQTFDPFMIDICLAFKYGCCLVMTNNDIRCNEDRLLNTIFPVEQQTGPQITIMQTTPSLFMRWSKSVIRTRIFSNKSELRILALGGEAFPSAAAIANWSNLDGKCRIFNLYGLTEMSCWASVYEITRSDIQNRKNIPIGNPIDEHTFFEVDPNNNELIIRSKLRKCIQPNLIDDQIFDSTFEFVLNTGDKVNVLDNDIFFHSRLNSIIKFYGQKIDLSSIEVLAKNMNSIVEETVCIYDEMNKSFILFVKWDENKPFEEMRKQIAQAISCAKVWITIQPVERFPLTAHGKIDKNYLLHRFKSCKKLKFENTSMIQVFAGIVSETLGCLIDPCRPSFNECKIEKRSKTIYDSSFKSLGGSSLKAIQIIERMEKEMSWSIPELLTMLLNEECTISNILDFVLQTGIKLKLKDNDETTPTDGYLKYRWRINTNKCVDATPTICILNNDRAIVSVGSHSKMLYNILIANGQILSKIELPDRIESQVTQVNENVGIVGCYDGYLYSFEFTSGNIVWKFDSGGMIKCRALLIDSFVIFGNYNMKDNLWCLDVTSGQILWSCRIGLKSIYANPVNLGAGNFLVATLGGQVAKMSVKTNAGLDWTERNTVTNYSSKTFWTFTSNSPIFATPVMIKNENNKIGIFFTGVSGTIYCLNESGDSVSTYQIDGNIFTTFEVIQNSIFFGSQNNFLYSLSYNIEDDKYEELWKRNMDASIRSSPIHFKCKNREYILCITTNGILNIIETSTRHIIHKWSTGKGDSIFSSPVIWQENVFFGSRNNFIYCVSLEDILT